MLNLISITIENVDKGYVRSIVRVDKEMVLCLRGLWVRLRANRRWYRVLYAKISL